MPLLHARKDIGVAACQQVLMFACVAVHHMVMIVLPVGERRRRSAVRDKHARTRVRADTVVRRCVMNS